MQPAAWAAASRGHARRPRAGGPDAAGAAAAHGAVLERGTVTMPRGGRAGMVDLSKSRPWAQIAAFRSHSQRPR